MALVRGRISACSACGGGSAVVTAAARQPTRKNRKNEVTMARVTTDTSSRQRLHPGRERPAHPVDTACFFAYKSTLETPCKINSPRRSLWAPFPRSPEDGTTTPIKLQLTTLRPTARPSPLRDVEFWWNLVTNNKGRMGPTRRASSPDGADLEDHRRPPSRSPRDCSPRPLLTIRGINKVACSPPARLGQDQRRRGRSRPRRLEGAPEGSPAGRGGNLSLLRYQPAVADEISGSSRNSPRIRGSTLSPTRTTGVRTQD